MTRPDCRRLVVGVIGHVDHGKTALVKALTGEDTDRLPEEKSRGISIALGFAHLQSGPDAAIDLIDMPGHERFVRTMISGATGIDAVLLVVAANEGIKPQTVEHVDIAALLGLKRAVVAVTKTDLVTDEAADRIAGDTMELLTRSGFDAPSIVLTSAAEGKGIDELQRALELLAARQVSRQADGFAYLPVDRAFTMTGHGPVVTGTLRGARVAVGDRLELIPAGKEVRVRAVQVRGERIDAAMPGQRVALNLRDVEAGELGRGMALAAPGALVPSDWLTIAVRAVGGAPPLKNGMRLRVLIGTDEFNARLRLLGCDVLEQQQDGFAQLHCERAVSVPAREHAILRLVSPARTIAGGRVLEPVARRLKRHSPPILQRLTELRNLAPDQLIAAEVERAGGAGTSLRHLSQLTALPQPRIAELLAGLPVVVTRAGLVVHRAKFDTLFARIPPLLAPLGEGLSQTGLLAVLPGTGAAVLDEALDRLLADGVVARRGSRYLVPKPEEDRARARSEEELAAQLAAMLRGAGLTPPNPGDIVTDAASRRAIDRLLREGVVIRTVDRAKGKEMLFHQDAIEAAQRVLDPLLDKGEGLLVSEIAEALGISRKFVMPLLDHLDTMRFTRRIGDRRLRGLASLQRR